MKPKKSLGQHFLTSTRALDVIVDTGDIQNTDTVLEIGPGKGVLTERLLEKAGRVVAIEKDDELFELLSKKFEGEVELGKLELIHGDILVFEPKFKRYKLIANIPYNITGAILEKFLSCDNQPERVVLLVQKEVAERIVARDDKESILSLSVKIYGEPKYIEKVLAGSFSPAPRVNSAIILISDISKGRLRGVEEGKFFRFIKAGFASKRKKLSSNLSKVAPKERVLEVFQELGLDENLRAEDLKVEKWVEIVSKL